MSGKRCSRSQRRTVMPAADLGGQQVTQWVRRASRHRRRPAHSRIVAHYRRQLELAAILLWMTASAATLLMGASLGEQQTVIIGSRAGASTM
jgi:3-methyladenine DNA glycosylase/8-oxoguanine DNA glycosylase